jgi:hypothetical protein
MRRLASRPIVLAIGSAATLALVATSGSAPAAASDAGHPAHPAPDVATIAAAGDPTGAAGRAATIGRWKVAPAGPGAYTATWTSPSRLPYSDARPEVVMNGRWAGPAAVSADGRRVSVVVSSEARPAPADFDVLFGGRVLDQRGQQSPARARYQRPAQLKELSEDPGVPGFHGIAISDYELDPVRLPNIPELAEMVGHVVAPTDATDASPLVLFLHGRHEPCYTPRDGEQSPFPEATAPGEWRCRGKQVPLPSYLGYDYVQRLLASQGYVTVSISADAINALDFNAADGGAAARAALIRRHLQHWVDLVDDGDQHADLDNVILVGHSRGGEGVNRASLNLPTNAGYTVTGQVLIGPTDFGFQAAPLMPTVTVLPYCDGDVSDLQGQNFTDDGRDLGLGLAFHSSVLVMGANHNFFNTEWTPGISAAPSFDDWFGGKTRVCGVDHPERLSAAQQRKVGKTYIAGAVHLFADDDQDILPMYDGSAVSVPSAGNADVRSHAIGGGLDIRRPGLDASAGTTDGASLRLCVGVADTGRPKACEPRVGSQLAPHWPSTFFPGVPLRRDFELQWTATDQTADIDLTEPWDLSDASHVDLRTIVDPALGRAKLDVELFDGGGGSAVVTPEDGGLLLPLPGRAFSLPKRWGQTLRLDLDGVTGVDLSDIVTVGLISRSADGRVWILDLSAAPSTGISEPAGETPLISFGRVKQDEGDGPDPATLEIPYDVTGELPDGATVNVTVLDPFARRPGTPQELVIPPGTTHDTFAVEYQPNAIADYRRRTIQIVAFPTSGIETDSYIGFGTIIDDDPVPTVRVTPVARRVSEGHPAQWEVSLSAPLGFSSFIVGTAVRAVDGRQLTVGDLPKKFRKRHFFPVPPLDTPLPKSHLHVFQQLRHGNTSVTISIPVRRTKSDDGARSVSIRFRVFGIPGTTTRTVRVVEPRA